MRPSTSDFRGAIAQKPGLSPAGAGAAPSGFGAGGTVSGAGAAGTEPRAVGVAYVRDGRRRTVAARKEVVLAAGAIGSPQLLMVSGVGPKEHLAEVGVPVVRDLKVGHNLQDHVGLGGLTFLVDEPVTFKKSRFTTAPVAQVQPGPVATHCVLPCARSRRNCASRRRGAGPKP